MSFWRQIDIAGGIGSLHPWVLAGEIALALVLAAARPQARLRLRVSVLLLLASVLATLACVGILDYGPDQTSALGFQSVQFLAQLLYAVGTIQIGGTLLFRVLLPRVGLTPAPIFLDALFGVAYVVASLFLLGRHGVNLGGIIATSAVLTAVIGFSLQETLGNIIGGVSVQAERSIAVGAWVRIGDIEGRVHETRAWAGGAGRLSAPTPAAGDQAPRPPLGPARLPRRGPAPGRIYAPGCIQAHQGILKTASMQPFSVRRTDAAFGVAG